MASWKRKEIAKMRKERKQKDSKNKSRKTKKNRQDATCMGNKKQQRETYTQRKDGENRENIIESV